MTDRNTSAAWPLIVLLAVASVVYSSRLQYAPMFLASDEAIIAIDAHALSQNGRTSQGVWLPLFFHVELSDSWFMPAIYYLTAAFLQILPFAEWSIRVPTVFVGLLDIALMYFVASRVLRSTRWGLVAAATLSAVPAHFIMSRYALDYIYPLPFILAWLLCLLIALDGPRSSRFWFAAAGLCLGAGWYSYIASIIIMPAYLVFSLALVVRRRDWRGAAALTAGFAAMLIPFALWWIRHPGVFAATAARYGFVKSAKPGAVSDVWRAFDPLVLLDRYWHFFDPGFLFLTGDTYLPFSTRLDGVFPFALAVLMPLGVFLILFRSRTEIGMLVVAGFFAAPIAATLLPDEGAIRRAMGMVPFGVLLAAIGARQLWEIERVPWLKPIAWLGATVCTVTGLGYIAFVAYGEHRLSPTAVKVASLGAALLVVALRAGRAPNGPLIGSVVFAAVVVQFALLNVAYYGEYRTRSGAWLNGNMRGVMEGLIAESDRGAAPAIYFATLRSGLGYWDLKNRWMPSYWKFYLLKHDREELLSRTRTLATDDDISQVPAGSIILGNEEDRRIRALIANGDVSILSAIPEVNREPFFLILRR